MAILIDGPQRMVGKLPGLRFYNIGIRSGSGGILCHNHITRYLEQDIASMHETNGSPLYYVGNFGEIVFLIADCLIALFFVTRGIMNAWKATWGR
jgi:hypothetical protein